ncbi:hypothetical protein F4821DRAFT_84060 [Hypoxylon rubiginosum]|uniref:Uncharacterized protein n=1 Tax=Hypoxylon rubiginosum TaxID=110542 RepID=A0ACC0CIG1_9PEZI|nr:hypothetical protein F4821DRAFT_84060 [Hypoxylon rubiginosum]
MDSPDDTKMLVEALGGLPLGLAQAAQYIRARKLSYRNFLDIFHEKREILQDKELPGFWEYTKNPGGSESEANKQLRIGIQTTWVMSFEYLESCEDGASKCHLLTLSAYLDTKSISGAAFDPWLSRVARAIQDSDSVQPEVDETTVNPTKTRIIERSTWARPLLDEDRRNVVFLDFLADAQKIGLISIKEHGPNGPVYWIHALVARWLRRQYDDDYILEAAFLTSELNRSLYKSNPNTDLIYEAIRHSTSCINLKTHLRNLTFGVGDLRDVGLALCLRANFAGNQSLEVYDILRFAANEIARLEPSMSRLLHHSDGDYSMSSILFDMGSIKQARGENVEAVKDLLRAKQAALSEDDADIFIGIVCGLIDLYVAQNDNEKLVSIYDDLPKKLGNRLSPFFLSLHDILSYTLHHLKPRPNLSSKAVERLLNSTQDMPEIITRYYLAMSYSFTGDYEQVITQLELVLHSNTQMNDFRERERDLAFLRVASSLLRTVALHRNNRISHPEMVHQTVTYITESEQLSDIEKSRLTSFMLVIFKGSIIDLVDVIHLYLWKLFAETENPEGSIIHSANALKFSLYMAILEGTLSYQQLKDAKALIKVNGPLLESKQEHSLNQALALGYKVLGELEESI